MTDEIEVSTKEISEEICSHPIEESIDKSDEFSDDVSDEDEKSEEEELDEIREALSDDILTPVEIARTLFKRVKKDKDAVVAITGEEGIGKSSLANWLVIEILKLQGKTDEEILNEFNNHIMYSPNKDELNKKIISLPKYSPINADEAVKILYKQNWASVIQRYLNMLYAICRQENKITILCMPRFTDFNEFFRNHRIKYWINVVDRGKAILFIKDFNIFNQDPWYMKYNFKTVELFHKKRKLIEITTREQISMYSKLKIFVGEIKFDDLPVKIKHIYLNGKRTYGKDDMFDQVKRVDSPRAVMIAEKYKEGLRRLILDLKARYKMPATVIAETSGIGYDSIINISKGEHMSC